MAGEVDPARMNLSRKHIARTTFFARAHAAERPR